MNIKRQLKQAKLLNKLFYNLLDDIPFLQNYKHLIHFKIQKKLLFSNHSYCQTFFENSTCQKIIKIIIVFDLKSQNKINYCGYSSDYYGCRNLILSFTKNNKKLSRKFTLLHELKHAIDRLKGYSDNYFNQKKVSEGNADKYAINYLRYKGIIVL